MKILQFFILFLLMIGCGQNAHITDSLITPVTPTPPIPPSVPDEIRSYIGTSAQALNGYLDTNFFSELGASGTKSLEDFDSLIDSTVLSLSSTIDGVMYTLVHSDDDGGLGVVNRNIYIESPASQDGASSGSRGLDLRFGSNSTLNMLSVSFDQPVAHIGLDVIDLESSSANTLGLFRLYDCVMPVPNVIHSIDLDFGAEDGDAEIHFIGASSTQAEFCHFTVSVGDDGPGDGLSEKLALDNIRFGTAKLSP